MRGRPGQGAVIGLAVGAALVALVIWLPAAVSGDFYEISDPLIFMGLPMVIVAVAIGALIGVPVSSAAGNGSAEQPALPSRTRRLVVAIVAVTAALLAAWFFLMAIGAV